MTWSIEDLQGDGYGLVETVGRKSRTVYIATDHADAMRFMEMAEVYELVKSGAPVEAFKAKAKQGRRPGRK